MSGGGSAEILAGVNYLNEQRYLLAAVKFREAVEIDPKNLRFIYNLDSTLDQLHDYKNAITQFKKYIKTNPPDAEATYNYIGACYRCLNNNKSALKYYNLAREYDNVSTYYLSSIGSLYMENRQWDKAIPYIKKAIENAVVDDDIEEYHSILGEIFARMGQPQLGLEIAMVGYKSGNKPNFGAGFANYKTKKYSTAMIHFSAFIKANKEYLSVAHYFIAQCIWKSADKSSELNKVIEVLTTSIKQVVKFKYGRFWPKSHYRRGEIYLFYLNEPALALADFNYFIEHYEKAPIYWRYSTPKKFEYIKNQIRILESPLLPGIKEQNEIHFQVDSLVEWKKLVKECDVDKAVELKEHLQKMINNNLNIYDLDINSNTLLHWIANHIIDLSNDSSNPKVLAKIAFTFDIISLITQRQIPMANDQGALPIDLLFKAGDSSQRATISILINKYKGEAIRRMILKPNPQANSDLLDQIVKLLKQGAGADLLSKGKNIANFLIGQVFTDELKTPSTLESDYLLVYLAHLISIEDNNENLIDFVEKEKLFNTNSEIFFALRLRMFIQIIVHLFNALSLPSSLRNDKSQIINNLVEECSKLMELIEIHRLQTSIRMNCNEEIWLRCLAIRVTQKIKQLNTNERYLLHSSFNSHNIFIEFQKVSLSHYNIVIYNFGEGSSQYHETSGQKILPFVCRIPTTHFEENNISPIVFNILKSNSGVMNLRDYLNLIYCSFPDVCKLNQTVISFSQIFFINFTQHFQLSKDIEISFIGRRPKNRNNCLLKTYQCVLQNGYQSIEFFNWIRVIEFQLLPLNTYFNEQNILNDRSNRGILSKVDKNKLERLLKKSQKLGNNSPNANQNNALLNYV